MRLSTDSERDHRRAAGTIIAAVEAGITVFDTAHAYGWDSSEAGHNERLLAAALRDGGAQDRARIVTKGGMARVGGAWIPDGRAGHLLRDCEASLDALDGLPIDLYLIHAPDPRTPWRTTLRALRRLLDDGLVRHVGLSNVTRRQMDETLDLVPITAVEISLGPFADRAIRDGMVEHCAGRGVTVIAHSPFGGPGRVRRLERAEALVTVAAAQHATPAETALAWLLGISPAIVAIPGARRAETARSAARAATISLDTGSRQLLDATYGTTNISTFRAPARPSRDGQVLMVMGIPGAGKSRLAKHYVDRGYLRLNRDERGGSLRDVVAALDDELRRGAECVVLDNTWLTRAARSDVIRAATRRGFRTRCVWLDVPLAQAQVNMVDRILDRFGALPTPADLRAAARKEPWLLSPTSQMRALRELEPPSNDEGFDAVERIAFAREASAVRDGGVFVAASAVRRDGWPPAVSQCDPLAPHLLFDWNPHRAPDLHLLGDLLATVVRGEVEVALCPHPGGPPACWCRPPLPGLPLAFARVHSVDPQRSTVIGTSTAHRTLAATLGSRFVGI